MPKLTELLQQYGLLIVFANVLLEQIGLPIPAFPILIVAGALAMHGQIGWQECLAVSLLACVISDFSWYLAGRRFGTRILATLCRISLSPDYCVSQTEDIFRRWGPKSLVLSKFIPGFNTMASPLAGALHTPKDKFLFFSMCGTALWAGSGLLIGALFHHSIDRVLDVLGTMGLAALVFIAVLFGAFMALKYWERRRFYKTLRMARITVDELRELIELGHEPVILDARSLIAQELEPPIPGAILFGHELHVAALEQVPKERQIIVYCTCPNEASAAIIAKQLVDRGFRHVRPLIGGLDAWNAAFPQI